MSAETRPLPVRQFFSRNGVLADWHPNYEYRPGQLQMAEAVERAIKEERHLIVEAGTGTGKTLAYLIPAILSGKRVVVSTGTKSLQEQLYFKDIPFLQKHFPREIHVSYMKGRNNYACRQKIYDAEREPVLSGLEEVTDFQIIREWEKTTEVGDRAEIVNLPPGSSAWSKLDARRELCTGQKCPNFDRCFITGMLQRAHASDIIIVNHHLFFADLAVKESEYGGIIPDYDAVIFDEAHEIESVAGTFFGLSVSTYMFQDLRRDIIALSRKKDFGSQELDRVLIALEDTMYRFFDCFPEQEGRNGFSGQQQFSVDHHGELTDLLHVIELVITDLKLVKGASDESAMLAARADDIRGKLKFWMRADDPKFVYWTDRRGRNMILEATPINVSDLLRERVFQTIPTVVLTSATLAVAGNFDFIERRLGIDMPRTLIVDQTFDFQKQALLYVPQHLPDPRQPEFLSAAIDETVRLLEISEGRAFVLFTSYAQMRAFHERISLRIDYPVLLQGSGPNNALLEQFRKTDNCVLFATASFWQGIDVPGDQLSCVIVDRLPFAVPSDPIVEARVRSVREAGGIRFSTTRCPRRRLH